MGRYSQTIARIASGYSVIGALIWLLWPSDLGFVDNPEAWFALVTALVVWHLTEVKTSEEITSGTVSQNDLRVAREIMQLHTGEFRYLLKDTDLWSYVDSDIYSRLGSFCDRWDRGALFFHNRKLNSQLSELVSHLKELGLKIAQDTVPEMIGGALRAGYKPFHIVSEGEYARRMKESKEANQLASRAWIVLDRIVADIRRGIPEVVDEPL